MSVPSDRLDLIDDTRLTLRFYVEAIRRRWWLLVVIPLAAFAAAAVPSLNVDDEFASTVTVRIHSGDPAPPVTGPDDAPAPTVASADLQILEVETELSVLRSSGLRADVVEALGPDGAGFGEISATRDGFSSAIDVRAVADTADAATAAARAYGEVYVSQRTEQVIEPLFERAEDLRVRAVAATDDLAEIDRRLADPATEAFLIGSLQAQRAGLDREVSDLDRRADVLEIEAERRAAQTRVISPASSASIVSAGPLREGLKWLVVGLGAGLAAAVLLRLFVDDR